MKFYLSVILFSMEQLGASILERIHSKVEFSVYTERQPGVSLLLDLEGLSEEIPMERTGRSLYRTVVEGRGLELRYKYLLKGPGGEAFPDPYSHYPVSYTHLDVYKRQEWAGSACLPRSAWRPIRSIRRIFSMLSCSTGTVSYTHLRIFKYSSPPRLLQMRFMLMFGAMLRGVCGMPVP